MWAGLSKLPRRQPIGDALDELMTYNLRVRRVKQMIGAVEDDVLAAVEPLLPLEYSAANQAANAGAAGSSTFGFQAYLRLKLLSVVEGIATSVCRVANYPPPQVSKRRACCTQKRDFCYNNLTGAKSDRRFTGAAALFTVAAKVIRPLPALRT